MNNEKKEEKEIHFEKETLAIKESFEEEIRFLEKEGAITLAYVHIQEQYMNEKKEVNRYDLIEISDAIENFLRILSLMDAYRYFQSKNQALTDENIGDFLLIVKNDFLIRQNKFLIDYRTQKKSKSKSKSKYYKMKIEKSKWNSKSKLNSKSKSK